MWYVNNISTVILALELLNRSRTISKAVAPLMDLNDSCPIICKYVTIINRHAGIEEYHIHLSLKSQVTVKQQHKEQTKQKDNQVSNLLLLCVCNPHSLFSLRLPCTDREQWGYKDLEQ